MEQKISRVERVKELVIPVALFASLGAFSWAVRGSSGFGAVPGSMFAGLLWAVAWYYLSREVTPEKSRRYNLGWCLPAIMIGIGIMGMHGWMVWPRWVNGGFDLYNNGMDIIPINPAWGYVWFFIAGAPWAGMGAVFLAWTGSKTPLNWKNWIVRIIFGAAGGLLALALYFGAPQLFLPLYDTGIYAIPMTAGAEHAFNESRDAWLYMGILLGWLTYEIVRKDWVNVKLIVLVAGIAGGLWSAFQVIQYMSALFPTTNFNFWRVWESNGGVGIGIAYGIAYYYCNRSLTPGDPNQRIQRYSKHPNAEKIWAYLALIIGLGFYVINSGTKGFNNIYFGNDDSFTQPTFIPIVVGGLVIFIYMLYSTKKNPLQIKDTRDPIPQYSTLFYIIYFTSRAFGLLVTSAKNGDIWGPWAEWSEFAFFLYYIILMVFDQVTLANWRAIRSLEGALEHAKMRETEQIK